MSEPPSRNVTRRELLKLSPLLALGAFAVPSWRDRLVEAGVAWSDHASSIAYREGRLAPVFVDADLVPFHKVPYNYYDVADPGVDLDRWTLAVAGAVARPGAYTLDQIRSLPKVTHRRVGRQAPRNLGNFI